MARSEDVTARFEDDTGPPRLVGPDERADWLRCLQAASSLSYTNASLRQAHEMTRALQDLATLTDMIYRKLQERCPR
jgi:hypothetical protein